MKYLKVMYDNICDLNMDKNFKFPLKLDNKLLKLVDINTSYDEFKTSYISLFNNMSNELMYQIFDMIEGLLYNFRENEDDELHNSLYHENLLLNLLFSLLIKDGKVNFRNFKCNSILVNIFENWMNPNITERQGIRYSLKVIGYVNEMMHTDDFKICCECLRVSYLILVCSKVFNFSDIELECQAIFKELMSMLVKDVEGIHKSSYITHYHSNYMFKFSDDLIDKINRVGFLKDNYVRGVVKCTSNEGLLIRNIRYKIYEEVTYRGVRVLFVITDGDFRLVSLIDFSSKDIIVCMDFLDFSSKVNCDKNIQRVAEYYLEKVFDRYIDLIQDSTKTNLNILTNNIAEGSISIDTLLDTKDLKYVPKFLYPKSDGDIITNEMRLEARKFQFQLGDDLIFINKFYKYK